MATDSTELTFVRCPACRSLVPAVSTRCRMCGATLDASLGSENTQPPSSGRVRQKTMTTAGSSELAEQIGKVREAAHEDSVAAVDVPPQGFSEPAPVVESAPPVQQASTDPLSGYLDDTEQADMSEDDFGDEEEDLIDADHDDDFGGEEHTAEIEDLPPVEPQIASAEESLEKAKEVLTSMGVAEPKKEESKPRVVVEQGKGRFNKAGLSFGAKSEPSQRRFDVPRDEVKTKTAEPPEHREEARHEEVKRETPPVRAPEREVRKSREEDLETPPRERVTTKAPRKDSVKQAEGLGRLFGWLVNYNEPLGTSIELREGRFFVSATQLRPTDLVLDDTTISTPHAMFTIGLDTGIVVQDLKSDRGVFIRERNASTYQREYDSATLQHGDWIRFGDLEFLVSIIAHVGEK